MVAPAGPRAKWRDHCATCGRQFKRPRRSAYCSKDCEHNRRGGDHECRGIDEWLDVLHEERLRLHRELEDEPRYRHDEIRAQIAANEAREAAVRAELEAIDRVNALLLAVVGGRGVLA